MRILALDPATKCGWAVSANGHIVASGTWDLSVKRDESGGMRLIRLRSKLSEMRTEVDLLVYEAARHAASKMQGALVTQAELQSVIKVWCDDAQLPYRGYSPAEIKKHATGKGNAGKPMMLAAAVRKWPDWSGDDNEADARWLVDLAMKKYESEAT